MNNLEGEVQIETERIKADIDAFHKRVTAMIDTQNKWLEEELRKDQIAFEENLKKHNYVLERLKQMSGEAYSTSEGYAIKK